jgi:hypothetical protein
MGQLVALYSPAMRRAAKVGYALKSIGDFADAVGLYRLDAVEP